MTRLANLHASQRVFSNVPDDRRGYANQPSKVGLGARLLYTHRLQSRPHALGGDGWPLGMLLAESKGQPARRQAKTRGQSSDGAHRRESLARFNLYSGLWVAARSLSHCRACQPSLLANLAQTSGQTEVERIRGATNHGQVVARTDDAPKYDTNQTTHSP